MWVATPLCPRFWGEMPPGSLITLTTSGCSCLVQSSLHVASSCASSKRLRVLELTSTGELTSRSLSFPTYKMGLTISNYTPLGGKI